MADLLSTPLANAVPQSGPRKHWMKTLSEAKNPTPPPLKICTYQSQQVVQNQQMCEKNEKIGTVSKPNKAKAKNRDKFIMFSGLARKRRKYAVCGQSQTDTG
ncbi:MAG TPA: hypothetical protein VGZ29_04990 [Terriglobia bacterium]|nr:hypothetical protein [Terriglobia bacterium]